MRKRRLYKAKNEHNQTRSFYVGRDGRRHEYLNAAVPNGKDLWRATCPACGFGYSEMMMGRVCICGDCREDAIGLYEIAMKEQGIEVGARPKPYLDEQVFLSWFYMDDEPTKRVSYQRMQQAQNKRIDNQRD